MTHEIHTSLGDRWGNSYPNKSKDCITISKSASSSGDLILDCTKKVLLPDVGAVDEEFVAESGLVLDAFMGYFANKVKVFIELMEKLAWSCWMGASHPRLSH